MKKINNKYRNNNNQIYSLNYKFDSCSIAGKFSGTALDLIKRYNELAKEAHSNNDYVSAEVFRQYAEHYRKIVTEVNEKKNQNNAQNNFQNNTQSNVMRPVSFDCIEDEEAATAEIENEIGNPDIEPANPADLYDANSDKFNFNLNLDLPQELSAISTDNNYGSNVVEFHNEKPAEKKSFTVIEITPENSKSEVIENVSAQDEVVPKVRKYVRKKESKEKDVAV